MFLALYFYKATVSAPYETCIYCCSADYAKSLLILYPVQQRN